MSKLYRLASWNVNGLRAALKKEPSFTDIAAELDADILAIQETKLQEGQVELDLPGYHQVWSYAERKGYSGTAVFCREEPLSVRHAEAVLDAGRAAGLSDDALELVATAATEGRVCALEFEQFWLVDVYTPNAQNELARIETRMAWDDAYRGSCARLRTKPASPSSPAAISTLRTTRSTSRTPRPTAGTRAFPTRSAASSPSCSTPATPTRSA